MKLPKRTPEQILQRVSQMRRLGLSLREAYDKQCHWPQWLARFAVLRDLPVEQFPAKFSCDDIAALRAGFRENWAAGDYQIIVDLADKLPPPILRQDEALTAFAGAAREQLLKKSI